MSMQADDGHLKEGSPCPRCGEPLLVKKGRFGIFIGCSNYPECNYVHNPQESMNIN